MPALKSPKPPGGPTTKCTSLVESRHCFNFSEYPIESSISPFSSRRITLLSPALDTIDEIYVSGSVRFLCSERETPSPEGDLRNLR